MGVVANANNGKRQGTLRTGRASLVLQLLGGVYVTVVTMACSIVPPLSREHPDHLLIDLAAFVMADDPVPLVLRGDVVPGAMRTTLLRGTLL